MYLAQTVLGVDIISRRLNFKPYWFCWKHHCISNWDKWWLTPKYHYLGFSIARLLCFVGQRPGWTMHQSYENRAVPTPDKSLDDLHKGVNIETTAKIENVSFDDVNENSSVQMVPFLEGCPFEVKMQGEPNKCQVCFKTFTRPQDLRRHEKTHTGDRPYQCAVCCKAFARKDGLKSHMRIHMAQLDNAQITGGSDEIENAWNISCDVVNDWNLAHVKRKNAWNFTCDSKCLKHFMWQKMLQIFHVM